MTPKLVSVLNGGMKKWKLENRKVTNLKTKITLHLNILLKKIKI